MEDLEAMGFWTDRPVFVTGATGLLGSHMVAELQGRGAHAVCLVRDQVAQSHFQRLGLDRRAVIVRGCLEDYALLERALNEHEIDTVMHLGAQTIVGTASRNPMSTWETNVRGTYLLRTCWVNFRTTSDDIQAIPGIVRRVGAELDREFRGPRPI